MSIEPQAEAIEKQTGRLESFSDGVFAVAITLLVFNLQVPHLPTGAISVAALGSALFAQWPSYLTFITSFAMILIMWASHHGIFRMVYRADTPFLFANGLLLLLVTVVPFPPLPGGPVSQHARCGTGVCRLCRDLCRDQRGLQPALVGSHASAPPAAPGRDTSPGEAADAPHSAGIAGVRAFDPAGLLESLCESGPVQLPVDLLGLHLL